MKMQGQVAIAVDVGLMVHTTRATHEQMQSLNMQWVATTSSVNASPHAALVIQRGLEQVLLATRMGHLAHPIHLVQLWIGE